MLLVMLTACGGPVKPAGEPSPSRSAYAPPVAVTTGPAAHQVEAQARLFVTEALPTAYAAPVATRRAILSPLTMDPALAGYLQAMATVDRNGQQSRGYAHPFALSVRLDGPMAVVYMCANTADSGLYDRKTGRQVQHGIPRDSIQLTLKKDPAAVWKVAATSHQDTSC